MVPASAKTGGSLDHLSDGWLQKKGCTQWYLFKYVTWVLEYGLNDRSALR